MKCPKAEICGGCPLRNQELSNYRQEKFAKVSAILSSLPQPLPWGESFFIPDGTRRRASLTFNYKSKQLTLGFNQKSSNNIVDFENCLLLTARLNFVIPYIKELLKEMCSVSYNIKQGKKIIRQNITRGDVLLCDTQAGVDITLEFDAPLDLNHRMIISELSDKCPEIIRISHRRGVNAYAEPIIEKIKPFITIEKYKVYIPSGTFLQPSQEGETTLINLVKKYVGNVTGLVFDLFCGVGTFSYALASVNPSVKIVAVDSSPELLRGFRESINHNQITNLTIKERNLFKNPLDASELKGAEVVVFDPPRAGASSQVKVLAGISPDDRPEKIIAVSCHPATFVNDAKSLITAGYRLAKINMVDQFIYSNHSELVALFTKS